MAPAPSRESSSLGDASRPPSSGDPNDPKDRRLRFSSGEIVGELCFCSLEAVAATAAFGIGRGRRPLLSNASRVVIRAKRLFWIPKRAAAHVKTTRRCSRCANASTKNASRSFSDNSLKRAVNASHNRMSGGSRMFKLASLFFASS